MEEGGVTRSEGEWDCERVVRWVRGLKEENLSLARRGRRRCEREGLTFSHS